MEELKDKTNLSPSELGQRVFGEYANVVAFNDYLTRRWKVEASDQPKQRRFAAPRRPHNRHVLPGLNDKVQRLDNRQWLRATKHCL